MNLYRYRNIESAIKEIENHTFHFASREELNDPIEGFARIYWQGDIPAWEGLFRNYICSLAYGIENYLLAQDERVLWKDSLLIDVHAFDHAPMGEVFGELGDMIIEDEDVRQIVGLYGEECLKCSRDELHLILQFVHRSAYRMCMEYYGTHGLIPEDEVNGILSGLDFSGTAPFPFEQLREGLKDDRERRIIAQVADGVLNDLLELKMVEFGMKEEGFLYGRELGDGEDDQIKRGRQHRNWMSIVANFPQMYIGMLENMVYPEAYVVCFSGKGDDSAMWGNYADHHKGVCLVYEGVDDDVPNKGYYNAQTKNNAGISEHGLNARKVEYGGAMVERNFFESFGRLTIGQIKSWLTGSDGTISKCFGVVSEREITDSWRSDYWDAFMNKNYRKLKEWEYEDEYRIHVDNTFMRYEEPEKRNIAYDPQILKGIIFGIKTSEYDKMRVVKALVEGNGGEKVTFYQAVYDEFEQGIKIRKKGLWKIKGKD